MSSPVENPRKCSAQASVPMSGQTASGNLSAVKKEIYLTTERERLQ